MRKLRPLGLGACLIATLFTAACAETGSDAPARPTEMEAPSRPIKPATEEPPASQCSSQPDRGDSNCEPTPVPHTGSTVDSTVESRPQKVSASRLSISESSVGSSAGASANSRAKKYAVDFLIDKKWRTFSFALPDVDHTGLQYKLTSTPGLQAELTCKNADCSRSRVVLPQETGSEKAAIFEFSHLKMKPLYGEVQIDCETPVFFEYELDEILAEAPVVRASIERLVKADWVYTTVSRSQGWDGKKSDSIRVEIFAEGARLVALNDPVSTETPRLLVEQSRIPAAESFSYGLEGTGNSTTVSFIKARFPLKKGPVKELCYNLPLIPEALEW